MRRIIIIVVALFLMFGNVYALQESENIDSVYNNTFKAGERLVYTVNYKIGFNVEIATVSFNLSEEKRNGRDHFYLNAIGRVRPSFRKFFDMHDVYNVWIDKKTMRPSYFENNLSEGSYRFRSSYTYNWDEMIVHTWAHNPKYDPQFRSFALNENSLDALSLLYKLRTIDMSNTQQHKYYTLNVVFENKVRIVQYRYIGKQQKYIKGFGDFKVLVFVCSLATDSGKPYEDGGEFTIMFSDDQNKIPVYIQSPIKVGSVRVNLSSVGGLMYPMDALVSRSRK